MVRVPGQGAGIVSSRIPFSALTLCYMGILRSRVALAPGFEASLPSVLTTFQTRMAHTSSVLQRPALSLGIPACGLAKLLSFQQFGISEQAYRGTGICLAPRALSGPAVRSLCQTICKPSWAPPTREQVPLPAGTGNKSEI